MRVDALDIRIEGPIEVPRVAASLRQLHPRVVRRGVRARRVHPERFVAAPGPLVDHRSGREEHDHQRSEDDRRTAGNLVLRVREQRADPEGERQERQREVAILYLEVHGDDVRDREPEHQEAHQHEEGSRLPPPREGQPQRHREHRQIPEREVLRGAVHRVDGAVPQRHRRDPQVARERGTHQLDAYERPRWEDADHLVVVPDRDHDSAESEPHRERRQLPE